MKAALIVLSLLAVAFLAAVAGCAALSRRSTAATKTMAATIPGRVAVVFYSQSKVRNTGTVAAWIARHTGGDLLELEMAEPYPEPYGKTLDAAGKDVASGTLPALKAIPSLDGYDVVFLGSPIWYGTYAPPPRDLSRCGRPRRQDGRPVLHPRWRRGGTLLRRHPKGLPRSDRPGHPFTPGLQPDRTAPRPRRRCPPHRG